MSGKRHRHRRKQASSIPWRGAARAFQMVGAHPGRSFLSFLLGVFLCWAVLTKSLPYVLATGEPDLALALNPSNPAALLSKAAQTRERLLSHAGTNADQQSGRETSASGPGDEQNGKEGITIANLPKAAVAAAGRTIAPGVREELRGQMHRLAAKAVASDPLNAAAYRLLAETSGDSSQVRDLMREAVKRSRRETAAVFWLLNDSYARKDFQPAIEYVDILVRTRPEIAGYGFRYLLNISRDPEGRRLAAAWLAQDPSWRRTFLGKLWELGRTDRAGMALVAELRNTGRPAETEEIGLYVSELAWQGPADEAYGMWLQTLPPERADNLGFLTDPDFEAEPPLMRTAFDWSVAGGMNVAAEFVPSGRPGRQRLLHLTFGQGRIEFPEIRQVLVLPKGHYRLEGQLRGSIIGKRGLRWRLSCARWDQVLGETDMLLGESEEWRVFSLEAEVPEQAECSGQALRLVHDTRSASEEYLNGEAWFGSLHLERTAGPKTAARQ